MYFNTIFFKGEIVLVQDLS